MKSKSPHARAPDKLLRATKWRAVAQIRGPEDPTRLMGPGSAAQRDRTMLRIAGRTLHRVRDTRRNPIFSICDCPAPAGEGKQEMRQLPVFHMRSPWGTAGEPRRGAGHVAIDYFSSLQISWNAVGVSCARRLAMARAS